MPEPSRLLTPHVKARIVKEAVKQQHNVHDKALSLLP
jgi:hypothetical protein